jgi:hypothetical protein
MKHNTNFCRSFRSLLGITALLGATLMSSANASAAKTSAPTGVWGTTNGVLTFGAKQSRIEWGHGEVAIDGSVKVDANGRFKAKGRYYAYTPGPDRIDASPAMRDAHIEGRIVGDSMQLTMHVDGEREIRRFVFKKGQQTKLHRMY